MLQNVYNLFLHFFSFCSNLCILALLGQKGAQEFSELIKFDHFVGYPPKCQFYMTRFFVFGAYAGAFSQNLFIFDHF